MEIEDTREGMTSTVDEIGDRLDPKKVVADTKQSIRDATVGKVEAKVDDMATTANEIVSNAGQAAQETGDMVIQMIRRNPIPAAMVGIGAAWLWMNRSSVSSSTYEGTRLYERESPEGWRTAEYGRYDTTGRSTTDKIGQTAEDAAQKVNRTADEVGRKANELAGQVGQTADQAGRQVQGIVGDVRRDAGRMVQQNPIGAAVAAFAAGAAVGMVLPATKPEREAFGGIRDDLVGQAQSAASEVMTEAERKARQAERTARDSQTDGARQQAQQSGRQGQHRQQPQGGRRTTGRS
jgi:hypothetical protein